MKNKKEDMATRSVNRAAAKIFEGAMLRKQALSIWKGGKIKCLVPSQKQIDELLSASKKQAGTNP